MKHDALATCCRCPVSDVEHPAIRPNVDDYLVVPEADRFLSPILATVPAQLVAYFVSVARGIDPDFPRNLSKTLTVD